MRAATLRQLIQAFAGGDAAAFRKAVLQIASAEEQAGHSKVAEEVRQMIQAVQDGPSEIARSPISLARPPRELAGLLEAGYSDDRLGDIVLTPDAKEQLLRVIAETRQRSRLEGWGVSPSRKLLFYGPPGCGKTLAAHVLAGELGIPVMTLRIEGVFSRFLGETASHLRAVFDQMPQRPGVYLFDEFDAIGKVRGDSQDVGELRRVVVSFLQLLDADHSPSLIVAATNDEMILDPALFRRFDVLLHFGLPSPAQLEQLVRLRLASFPIVTSLKARIAQAAEGLSFADAARACDDAIRKMALDNRETLTEGDLLEAFDRAVKRAASVKIRKR